MAELTDPRQLFVLKLNKLYASEQAILTLLRTAKKEAREEKLVSGFEKHIDETDRQIKNVKQALDALGEKPSEVKPRVVEALEREFEDFKKQNPSRELVDAYLVGAAVDQEHFEIAAYEGLITFAHAMGEEDIVALLQENLEQEVAMLQKGQQKMQQLAPELAALEA